ncbi:hypothetical protein B0H13DRAFT_1920939 [Mycena leptocephala]|nr:hypothetical protein B0H13DRAFT_1920939 [Mycena leptocephala]
MATQDCLFSDKMQRPVSVRRGENIFRPQIVLMRKMFAPKPRPAVPQPTPSEPPTATELTPADMVDYLSEHSDSDEDGSGSDEAPNPIQYDRLCPQRHADGRHDRENFAKGQDEQKGHATSENTDTLFVYISSVHVASEAAFRISWYSYNADAQSSSRADPTTGPEKALTGAEYLTNISTRCVVEKILKKFPHPVPERRLLWDSISKRPSNVATGTKSPSQKCRHAKEMAREMCGDDEDTQQQV